MRKSLRFLSFLTPVLMHWAAAADAGPRHVRLSYPLPDTATSIGIAWNSDSTGDGSVVEYGADEAYGLTRTGSAFQGPGELLAIHEVTLTELIPGYTYHYRVGGPDGWSGDRTFTTTPGDACSPLQFVVLGDDRSDDDSGASPRWTKILEEAVSSQPLFLLNSGDLVREGKQPKQWRNWLERSGDALAAAPHMPTIGNHDDGPVDGDGAVYNQVFHLPRNTVTNTEDFYWFTAGNAIVVSLSSQTYEGGGMGSQAAWLDQVLTDNPRLWKFVFFHHPVYTSSSLLGLLDVSHPPNEVDQNAALTPVFDKHHVDFVFYGHNHFYERFQPMRGNGGDEEGIPVDDPEDGTYYVVSGGGGALTYNIAIGLFCGGAKGSAKCSGSHHFVRIEIERNRLKYTARATAQQLLNDNPGNSKDIESFTYEKAYPGGVDPCFTAPPEPGPEPVPEPIPEAPQEDAGVPVPDVADAPVPELPVAADLPATPDGSASPDVPTADLDRPDVPAPPPDQGSQADASATVPDTGTGASNPSSGGCGAAAFGGGPVAVSALVLLLGAGLRRRRHAG